jgi:RHS repeat-associated protein
MKYHPLILGFLIPAGMQGQITEITNFTPYIGSNYIFSKTILLTSSTSEYKESFLYFDGLGRLVQTVDYKASPTYKDMIQPVEYDNYGRETKKYLPYTASDASGIYRSGWKTEQSNFHSGIYGSADGLKAYAQTLFENSPLNRIIKQGAPGISWQPDLTTPSRVSNEHVASYQYGANIANEVYYWSITGKLSTTSNVTFTRKNYLASALSKIIVTDENGKPLTEYKDKQGKVVLKTDALEGKTYYIYDDLELLRCVIPPLAIEKLVTPSDAAFTTAEAEFKELCYYYEYDSRHRMIKKKLPGTVGYYTMQYDNQDRLTLTIDPNGIIDSIIYDIFSRPVQTTNKTTGQWLTKTFYDTYRSDYLSALPYVNVYYSTRMNKMKGKVTVTVTRILNPISGMKDSLRSVLYYDKYGRVIQTVSENHKGTLERLSYKYKYNNADLVAEISTQHGINSSGTAFQTVIEKFTYDHTGRLLSVKHNLNSKGDTALSVMAYDEAGQMITKKLGNIQTNEFKYNIRGWLTHINNPDVANNGKLFNLKLEYVYYGNSNNITYMTWNNVDGINKKYYFSYDNLNRINGATYYETNANNRFNETYTYDANGNIKTAKRYGLFQDGSNFQGLIDDLNYVYYNGNYSNRLSAVGDAAADNTSCGDFFEYTNGSATQEYSYDNNGNMINDQNKYLALTYNCLNLPQSTSQYPAINTNYSYMANGTKIASKYIYNSTSIKTEYIGPFVYKNDILDYIITSEGRAIFSGGVFSYEYHIKDHLGNVRVAFKNVSNKASVLQKNDYYPFGLPMAASRINNATNKNKYLYNGKEYLEDGRLQMYDYGARMYDPQLGRFHTLDPMAVFTPGISPYTYADDNPVNYIDYYGLGKEEREKRRRERHLIHENNKRERERNRACRERDRNQGYASHWGGVGYSVYVPKPHYYMDDENTETALMPINEDVPNSDVKIPDPIPIERPLPTPSFPIPNAGEKVSFSRDLFFLSSTDNIYGIPENVQVLTDLVMTLQDYPQIIIYIYGNIHLDAGLISGNSRAALGQLVMYNQQARPASDLMRGRARAVYNYLISQGIDPRRLDFRIGNVYTNSEDMKKTTFEVINP